MSSKKSISELVNQERGHKNEKNSDLQDRHASANTDVYPGPGEWAAGFEPCYVGLERVANGHPLESEPIILMKDRSLLSRLGKVAFKTAGFAPQFLNSVARDTSATFTCALCPGWRACLADCIAAPDTFCRDPPRSRPTSFGKALPRTSLDNMVYSLRLPTLWKRASLFICVSEFVRRRALDSVTLRPNFVSITSVSTGGSSSPQLSPVIRDWYCSSVVSRRGKAAITCSRPWRR